jgi:hypothetical protein
MEWLSRKSLGTGGKKVVSEITDGGLAVEFMVVPRGEGGRDVRGESLSGINSRSSYRFELDARQNSVVIWDLTNSRGQRSLTEMGIGEEIGFGRVKVDSLEHAADLINLHSNQKSSRVVDTVIPERMLSARKSALEMAVSDKLHPFLNTAADLISGILKDAPRGFVKDSYKKVAKSIVSVMSNEDRSIYIPETSLKQVFRTFRESFFETKNTVPPAAPTDSPPGVRPTDGGPSPAMSPYRAGKEALAAQRGAILVPTTGEVQRPLRSLWNRLLGRKETLTNAPTNGPPTVRANGDNIDIPLADSVVRREPPAPTLNAMVGNDMGFENGRPMSGNNPNLLRGPPNQFRDFLEKQTYQKSEKLPRRDLLSSSSNVESDTSNYNVYAIGNKIPKNISDPIIQHAESLQGNSKYPGVDKFKVVLLKKDSIIYGGVPGQSPFYTTKSTLRRFGNDANAIYKGLQVVDRNGEYHPGLGAYRVKQDTYVAISITRANPQHGSGSAVQIVVKDFNSVLEPQFDYILNNRTKH